MRRSKPKQPRCHPPQVEFYFAVENNIGRARLDVLQQRFDFWRPLAEIVDELGLLLSHLFLLNCGANYDGACRECLSAGDVLRVEMSRREIELSILTDLGKLAQNHLPVSRPHYRVHNQRRPGSDDDA